MLMVLAWCRTLNTARVQVSGWVHECKACYARSVCLVTSYVQGRNGKEFVFCAVMIILVILHVMCLHTPAKSSEEVLAQCFIHLLILSQETGASMHCFSVLSKSLWDHCCTTSDISRWALQKLHHRNAHLSTLMHCAWDTHFMQMSN